MDLSGLNLLSSNYDTLKCRLVEPIAPTYHDFQRGMTTFYSVLLELTLGDKHGRQIKR